jgi:hypothetical protein
MRMFMRILLKIFMRTLILYFPDLQQFTLRFTKKSGVSSALNFPVVGAIRSLQRYPEFTTLSGVYNSG